MLKAAKKTVNLIEIFSHMVAPPGYIKQYFLLKDGLISLNSTFTVDIVAKLKFEVLVIFRNIFTENRLLFLIFFLKLDK